MACWLEVQCLLPPVMTVPDRRQAMWERLPLANLQLMGLALPTAQRLYYRLMRSRAKGRREAVSRARSAPGKEKRAVKRVVS